MYLAAGKKNINVLEAIVTIDSSEKEAVVLGSHPGSFPVLIMVVDDFRAPSPSTAFFGFLFGPGLYLSSLQPGLSSDEIYQLAWA